MPAGARCDDLNGCLVHLKRVQYSHYQCLSCSAIGFELVSADSSERPARFDQDGFNADQELRCRSCHVISTADSWLKAAAEDLITHLDQWNKIRHVGVYKDTSIIFPILLHRLRNGEDAGVSAAERAATSAYAAAHGPSFPLSEHPFANPGPWKISSSLIRLSQLCISDLQNASFYLDELAVLMEEMGTLHELSLEGSDIWTDRTDEASLKSMCRFAESLNRSNLTDLCLSSPEQGSPVEDREQGERMVLKVASLLENIDSISLRYLSLDGIPIPLYRDIQIKLDLVAARFLRRSVLTQAHAHPAHVLDHRRIGAPNLQEFSIVQRQGRDVAILAAAMTGTQAPASDPAGSVNDIAPCLLPPVRSVMTSDCVPSGRYVDVPDSPFEYEYESEDTCQTKISVNLAFYVFHPLNPSRLPSEASFDLAKHSVLSLSSHSSIQASSPQIEVLVDAARAQAEQFVLDIQQMTMEDASRLGKIRHGANSDNIKARQWAASAILAAGRVLTCQVVGKRCSRRPAPWLHLPADVRMAVLSACDEHSVLSGAQHQSVIAFAADRRTLGFGRLNEIILFPHRRHLELVAVHPVSTNVLDLVPTRWSWTASLRHALPGGWALPYGRDSHRYASLAQRTAFVAVTGCRTPFVDRDFPKILPRKTKINYGHFCV